MTEWIVLVTSAVVALWIFAIVRAGDVDGD
jgi:hypothetical protein